MTRRLGRVLRGTAVAVVLVLTLALVVEAVLVRRDAARLGPPGELVELPDGRRLHVQVRGADHPGPTVVFDAGAGSFSSQWALVQEQVAGQAPTAAYDRPGLGWSDPYPGPWDAEAVAADLATALAELDLPGPYVLVGHSLGSVYARVFAGQRPDDVAALVLVDPAHEDQYTLMDGADDLGTLRAMQVAAHLGLLRWVRPFDDLTGDLPTDAVASWTTRSYTAANMRGFVAEGQTVIDVIGPRLQAADVDLGATPLTVLRATEAEWPDPQLMRSLQAQLVDLSEAGHLVDVAGADHYSIVSTRAFADTVATTVLDTVADVRGALEAG